MAVRPNADEKVVGPNTYTAKLNQSESRVPAETGPRFKAKAGSVFLARRRSVKMMMLGLILRLFSASEPEARNAGTKQTTRDNHGQRVHPYTP